MKKTKSQNKSSLNSKQSRIKKIAVLLIGLMFLMNTLIYAIASSF